jgi:hypothetical protein
VVKENTVCDCGHTGGEKIFLHTKVICPVCNKIRDRYEKEKDDYYPGKGCKCGAYSESECGCSCVDWTDERVYKLEYELKSCHVIINKLQHFAIEHDMDMRDCKDIADVYIKYVENNEFEETELPLSKD